MVSVLSLANCVLFVPELLHFLFKLPTGAPNYKKLGGANSLPLWFKIYCCSLLITPGPFIVDCQGVENAPARVCTEIVGDHIL